MDVNLVLAAAVVMIAVGCVFIYMLLGRREGWLPRDAMEWVGSTLSVALIISAIALIGVALKASETRPPAPGMVVAPGVGQPEIIDMAVDADAGNFEFRAVSDDTVADLESLEGKVVLMNFWATWCAPCLQEIPELNKLQRDYAKRGLVVLSVSDEDGATMARFNNRLSLETYSVLVSPTLRLPVPFSSAFNIRPTTFVIDRGGRVRRFMIGARSYEIFERVITPYL